MTSPDLLETLLRGTNTELLEAGQRVVASRGRGDRSQVSRVEREVAATPSSTIAFDAAGYATVRGADRNFAGGRFRLQSVGELRQSVAESGAARSGSSTLSVIEGEAPVTDIGALQAMASESTLFQAASQFNCLESPGPYLTSVSSYFSDPTQGPRASISAFPGTLVRHYAAPDGVGGRFAQSSVRQLDLLADALPVDLGQVESGYLRASEITNIALAAKALENNFERIRVGVHDGAQVVLGHAWDGAVEGEPHIAQVFTSTLAAGGYGRGESFGGAIETICRTLLRAAYLGTLLAALDVGKSRAVLTMIGGGVFGNPHGLIVESALWAFDELERLGIGSLEVVLNSRDLSPAIDRTWIQQACELRGGVFRDLNRAVSDV